MSEDTLRAEIPKFIDILPKKRQIAQSAVSDRVIEQKVVETPKVEPEIVDMKGKPDHMTQAQMTRDEAKGLQKPEIDSPADEAEGKQSEEVKKEADGEETKADDTPAWMKAKISKEITRLRKENDARLADLESRYAQAIANISKVGVQEPQEPKLEMFATTEDYAEAKAQWLAEQKVKKIEVETVQQEEKKKALSVKQQHEARMRDAEDRFPDINEIATDPTLPISQAMGLAIMRNKLGPDLLVYLNSHRGEAEVLAKMDAVEAAAEIGVLTAKLQAKPEPSVSRTPKPLNPVGANNAVQKNKYDPDLPSDDYWKAVDAEKAAKLRDMARH